MPDHKAAAEGLRLHRACVEQAIVLRGFMTGPGRSLVDRFAVGADGVTVQGLYLRALAWIDSLTRLTESADFQAISSGARALLEICVDLTLLAHARADYPAANVLAWEESVKLKASERILRRHPKDVPGHLRETARYAAREGDRIRAMRERLWGLDSKGRPHAPERWTGPGRSLEADAVAADKLMSDGDFAEFYDERHAQLCWSTHGSGLAAVRNIPERYFPGVAAIAAGECVRFGFLACQLALDFYGLDSDPITYQRLRALALEGARVSREALQAPLPE